jgi:hypothetical protein
VSKKTRSFCSTRYTVGTSDFDAQMSGIKFWKGDDNLRPVFKKLFLELLNGCLHFDLFLESTYGTHYTLTILTGETFFFFEQVEWGVKKSVFYSDFKNVHLNLSKKCTKKKVAKKTDLLSLIFQLAKKFFG